MKSENPKSGFYEADVTRTLDCNGGNPSCNQGGMVVVQSGSKEGRIVAGFKSKPSEKAGSVAYGIETAPCLSAANHDACVMVLENHPNDSRIKLSKDNVVQTLSKRMGTGGATHR